MDKRSILFLVCVSAAYFGINAIFGMWQGGDQINQEKKISLERFEKEHLAQTVSSSDLSPIEPASNTNEQAAASIQFGNKTDKAPVGTYDPSLKKTRELSDYDPQEIITQASAEQALANAEAFVAAVKALLPPSAG